MSKLTNANMRALVQELVADTSTTNPGLSTAQYTDFLNEALYEFSQVFGDHVLLTGIIGSLTTTGGAGIFVQNDGPQSVASCTTTTSSVDVNTAVTGGFTNLVAGMTVSGTGITAGTTVQSVFANGTEIHLSQVATANGTVTLSFGAQVTAAWRNINNVALSGSYVAGDTFLTKAQEVAEIHRLMLKSAMPGVPTTWAMMARSPGATDHGITLLFYPPQSANQTFNLYGTVIPTDLSSDSDLTPFIEDEDRIIVRMAAIKACTPLRRPLDMVQQIAAPLPDEIKAHLGFIARELRPNAYPEKAGA